MVIVNGDNSTLLKKKLLNSTLQALTFHRFTPRRYKSSSNSANRISTEHPGRHDQTAPIIRQPCHPFGVSNIESEVKMSQGRLHAALFVRSFRAEARVLQIKVVKASNSRTTRRSLSSALRRIIGWKTCK